MELEPETAGTSPASPQHHFTAWRDGGDAHSQPFRDSTGQDVQGGLGRGDVANRDHSVSLPASQGFAADRDDLWVFKKRKIGQLSVLQGWGHQKGWCGDVCGKTEWDTKGSRAGAPPAPVVSEWAAGLGTAPGCSWQGWGQAPGLGGSGLMGGRAHCREVGV